MPDQVESQINNRGSTDQGVRDDLMASVYQELRLVARSRLRQHERGQLFNTTVLVHEAYLRLAGSDGKIEGFKNRGHFFSTAAMAMRQILTDQARKRVAGKRGGKQRNLTFDEQLVADTTTSVDFLALDAALTKLGELDPDLAELVHLKYFVGFKLDEIAELRGVSNRTISRDWHKARAFLHANIVT